MIVVQLWLLPKFIQAQRRVPENKQAAEVIALPVIRIERKLPKYSGVTARMLRARLIENNGA